MAKRRTREEKIKAEIKKQEVLSTVPTNYITHDYSLSTDVLKRDLTKSLIVTILALILLFSLAAYLNRGGWLTLNKMFSEFIK